jgi:hypothetical protein
VSSPAERKEQQRAEKLRQIDEQVAAGKLVIRKMTAAERAANPPRPAPERRAPRWR